MLLQKHFFGEVQRDSKKKEWTLWVYMLGTADEALDFEAKITVSNGGKGSLTFTVPVNSVDMSVTDVYESGAHASFPDVIAKRMWKKEEERISIEFEVQYSWTNRNSSNQEVDKPATLFKCCNLKHGCDVELTNSEIEIHQKECDFRQIKCLYNHCKHIISISKLKEHFQIIHTKYSVFLSKNTLTLNFSIAEETFMSSSIYPQLYDLSDKTFFTFFGRIQGAGQWCFWIYLVGTPAEADQFQFSVKMSKFSKNKKTKPKIGFQCSAPVSSVDFSTSDVIKRGSFCGLSDLSLQQILGEKKGVLSSSVTIQKVKNESETVVAKAKKRPKKNLKVLASSSEKLKNDQKEVAKKSENT